MQQTMAYWRLAAVTAVAGVALAFVGAACTVTTTTDNGGSAGDFFAGAPGAGAATAGAGGASTAGAAGAVITAGSAGVAPVEYACDVVRDPATPASTPNPPAGTPYSSCAPSPDDPNDVCAVCVQAKCCEQYKACYAYAPGDQCGYGGPMDKSEIVCIQECIKAGVAAAGAFEEPLVGTCAAQCATQKAPNGSSSKECGVAIGYRTSDLVDCLTMNCQTPCYGG